MSLTNWSRAVEALSETGVSPVLSRNCNLDRSESRSQVASLHHALLSLSRLEVWSMVFLTRMRLPDAACSLAYAEPQAAFF